MQGTPEVITALQAQLRHQLTAINQYYMHYRMLKHWGFEVLARKDYKASIESMKHSDRLMERILMLDGLPNLQDLGKLHIGETAPEVLACDLRMQEACMAQLRAAVQTAETARDFVSRDLLQKLLDECEEQVDFLGTQLELLQSLGEQNYLQSQMGE